MFEGLRLAGLVGLTALLIGHWASDFSWYGFVSISADRGAAIAGDNLSNCSHKLWRLLVHTWPRFCLH